MNPEANANAQCWDGDEIDEPIPSPKVRSITVKAKIVSVSHPAPRVEVLIETVED